jgi:hypothetical protein
LQVFPESTESNRIEPEPNHRKNRFDSITTEP